MHGRAVILLAALATATIAATTATTATAGAASLAVGMGEEEPAMFSAPLFTRLRLKRVRYVAGYDTALASNAERQAADAFLGAAHRGGYQVLVSFAHSGVQGRARTLPSQAAYARAVKAFIRRYPYVRTYSPWDEVNTCSEPTCRSPRVAAGYYRALKQACRGCTVLGAEVLDTDYTEMRRYLQAFIRYVGRPVPQVWGLHPYSDVNRFRTIGTRTMLATVPGKVWMTEVGGLYSFGRSFPPSTSRQVRATKWMFRLATSSPRIPSLYIYSWAGGGTFDAGLMWPNGSARPAYDTVVSELRALK
jgi:hypothetical protein